MTDDKPTVYLAGPIMFADDGGHGWRDEIVDDYPDEIEWINPLNEVDGSADELTILPDEWAENYDTGEDEEVVTDSEIVEDDKRLIEEESDAIFVGYYDRMLTWGTPQEQIFGYDNDTPAFTWHKYLDWGDECSPWLRHHSEFHSTDRDEVVEAILEWYDGGEESEEDDE